MGRKKGTDEADVEYVWNFAGQLLALAKAVAHVHKHMQENDLEKIGGLNLTPVKRGYTHINELVSNLHKQMLDAISQRPNSITPAQMAQEIESLERKLISEKKRP